MCLGRKAFVGYQGTAISRYDFHGARSSCVCQPHFMMGMFACRGGVVSAEEMAPFLDPPGVGRRVRPGPNKYEDEAFVLPALIKFGGEPFVDEQGHLLYKFPTLQVAASSVPELRFNKTEARVPLEKEWEFSAASAGMHGCACCETCDFLWLPYDNAKGCYLVPSALAGCVTAGYYCWLSHCICAALLIMSCFVCAGQQAGAFLLGLFNVVGIITLSSMLADPMAKLALYREGLGFVLGLLPALQGYAAAFAIIPLVRTILNTKRNAELAARNDNRMDAVSLLQTQDAALSDKVSTARKLGKRRVIGPQDVVYTTEQGVDEQVNSMDEGDFDRKLRGNARGAKPPRGQLPSAGLTNARWVDDVFDRRAKPSRQIEVEWQPTKQRRREEDWDRIDRW